MLFKTLPVTSSSRSKPVSLLTGSMLLLSCCCYLYIGYGLEREQFTLLISCYLLLFAAYLQLLKKVEQPGMNNFAGLQPDQTALLLNRKSDLSLLIAAAIAFRLAFLFSLPALSDDYFRFAWDGYMLHLGENPYTIVPAVYMQEASHQTSYLMHLFKGMNSQVYFTVYPPVCQFLFGFSASLFPGNLAGTVTVMRTGCIAAEVGTIFLLPKILSMLHLPVRNVLIYALNPLVIIELTGNIHPEAIMIFFLVLSVFFLLKINGQKKPAEEPSSFFSQKYPLTQPGGEAAILNHMSANGRRWLLFSALSCAAAIAAKLIPLLFLPMLIKRLKWQQISIYFLVTGTAFLAMLLPFINRDLLMQWGSSLQLYFQTFEFNAGIYYLIRWAGFQIVQYNIVQQAGPWLGIVTFIAILVFAVREKETTVKRFFSAISWSLTIYLLLATTVHPWYITTLVMCAAITGYKYPVVWSLLIVLSYATYQSIPYRENLLFTAIEYIAVLLVLIAELNWYRNKNHGSLVA